MMYFIVIALRCMCILVVHVVVHAVVHVVVQVDFCSPTGTIFLICFLMTIFKAYGLRLRHIIAACYYPRRERARAVWLYNHILKTRGGFLKFARRQMRRQAGTLREVQKISIRSRMMSQ